MEKRFNEWIRLKSYLHTILMNIPYVNEGDIWWASIGENIGYEINGKSKLFSRPVVVMKKLAHNFYLVIPTTSQNRKGTWYINFEMSRLIKTACLHQVRTIDFRRLSSKLGRLDELELQKLKEGFLKLYK